MRHVVASSRCAFAAAAPHYSASHSWAPSPLSSVEGPCVQHPRRHVGEQRWLISDLEADHMAVRLALGRAGRAARRAARRRRHSTRRHPMEDRIEDPWKGAPKVAVVGHRHVGDMHAAPAGEVDPQLHLPHRLALQGRAAAVCGYAEAQVGDERRRQRLVLRSRARAARGMLPRGSPPSTCGTRALTMARARLTARWRAEAPW